MTDLPANGQLLTLIADGGEYGELIVCPECQGSGHGHDTLIFGSGERHQLPCQECSGTGQLHRRWYPQPFTMPISDQEKPMTEASPYTELHETDPPVATKSIGDDDPLPPLLDTTWPNDYMLEAAWGIMANVSDGDWTAQSKVWRLAAAHWRDAYYTGAVATDPLMTFTNHRPDRIGTVVGALIATILWLCGLGLALIATGRLGMWILHVGVK